MSKKWINCISCDFQGECIVGKTRLQNYDKTSVAAEDIGCFNLEMIKKQQKRKQVENNKQLKLFEM